MNPADSRDELREALLALDYRMVEWWAADGTTYSLVQVISRNDAANLAASQPRNEDGLREALAQWKCPSCGGAGTYKNKGAATGYEVEVVECRTCGGDGLNPIASRALSALGGEAAE